MGSKYRDIKLMLTGAKQYTETKEELDMLEKYYFLVVNTDYLREDVYAFLVDQKTYKEIVEEFGVHENYVRNIIYKEIKRLFDDITEDPFALIRYKDYMEDYELRREKVEVLNQRLERIISNLTVRRTNDLLDYMVVNLEKYGNGYSEYEGDIDRELLDDTVERLQYLSQPYLDKLFSVVDDRIVGYIVYLLTTNNRRLSSRDVGVKEEICDMWYLPKR